MENKPMWQFVHLIKNKYFEFEVVIEGVLTDDKKFDKILKVSYI